METELGRAAVDHLESVNPKIVTWVMLSLEVRFGGPCASLSQNPELDPSGCASGSVPRAGWQAGLPDFWTPSLPLPWLVPFDTGRLPLHGSGSFLSRVP